MRPNHSLRFACHLACTFFLLSILGSVSAQQGFYSEGFESETPADSANLCLPVDTGYVPADGNWSLGPACAVPTNGIPKLVNVEGDTYLEFNQKYPDGSEVWNSATINVEDVDNVLIRFDARGDGGLENTGPFRDSLAFILVKDGAELPALVGFSGQTDGTGDGNNASSSDSSFTVSADVSDADAISLRIRVLISGSDGSESYQVDDFSVCADNNENGECDCDEEVTFSSSFDTVFVQCVDDLPDACDPASVTASRGTITCDEVDQRILVSTTCNGTSATGVPGPDHAVVLFNFYGAGHHGYFEPIGDGLTLERFDESGTATVTGQVADVYDATSTLNVYFKFTERTSGADWPGLFKTSFDCAVDTSVTNNWDIYLLSAVTSRLWNNAEDDLGGPLEGTNLTLTHRPATLNYGFQIGDAANDRNCGFGAGGWFSYEGYVALQPIIGSSGDLLLDLECGPDLTLDPCLDTDTSKVTITYIWEDPACFQGPTYFEQVTIAEDTEAPTLSPTPADTTIYCADAMPEVPEVTVTDNCDTGLTAMYSMALVDSTCPGNKVYERNWFAQDCSMNTVTYTQTITVQDNVAPVLTAALDSLAECDGPTGNAAQLAAWVANHGGATATDACSGVEWSTNPATVALSDDCGATGMVDVWFIATDLCGNADSTMATFTVQDTTEPTIDVMAADTTTECDGLGNNDQLMAWLANHGGANASDLCSGPVEWSYHPTPAEISDLCGETGSVTVWFVATDDCDNADSTQATFTIEDTIKPTISVTASDTTTECDGAGNSDQLMAWLANHGGASASDVCSGNLTDAHWSYHPNPAELSDLCGETGAVTVWFVATDDCGNADSTQATFTIEDTLKPTITTAAADTTTECDGAGNGDQLMAWLDNHGGAVATDSCSGPIEDAAWSYHPNPAVLSDACAETGEVTVWFVATDDCGNADSTQATFKVIDTTNPVPTLTAPNDTTLYADASCLADTTTMSLGEATGSATDVCDAAPTSTITYSDGSYDYPCDGSYSFTRTWKIVSLDACGNSDSTTAAQNVTVLDTIAPTWEPYTMFEYVACELMPDPTDPTAVPLSATDNCSGVSYEINAYNMSGGCPGTWMRVWYAIDACGNVSDSVEQYLQLYDDQPPVLTLDCPDTYYAEVDSDCLAPTDTAVAGVPTFTITDNCDDAPVHTLTYMDGDTVDLCGNTYSFTRTWRLTGEDLCAKKDTIYCDQTIMLVDSLAPVFSTAAMDSTVECDGAGNTIARDAWLADNGGAEASDNCGMVTWSNDYDTLNFVSTCGGAGYVDVWFVATDECGNADSTAARFTIADTTKPVITALTPFVVNCYDWACDLDVLDSLGAVSVADDCSDVELFLISCFETSGGSCPTEQAYIVKYAATDACMNTDTVIQLIQTVDNVDPYITVQAQDSTVECDGMGNTAALDAWVNNRAGAMAVDSCGNVTWTDNFDEVTPTVTDCITSYEVTFTATDDCDNDSETTATFTIEDTTPPAFTMAAADTTTECDGMGNLDEYQNWLDNHGGASAEEVCSSITWSLDTVDVVDGSCIGYETIVIEFTATDVCGLSSSDTASFNIEDTTAPTITVDAADTTVQCGPDNAATLTAWVDSQAGAMATETCSSVEWSFSDTTLSDLCGNTGAVTVTFYATDDCDLVDSTMATFTVIDTLAPAIGVMAMNDTVDCDGAGNLTELQAWLDGQGGALATEECGTFNWYNNFECTIAGGDFRTYNQGAGSNPGFGDDVSSPASDYLDANFAAVFPNGVSAGCDDGEKLVFNSAAAVDYYLPCTGSAQDLVLTHSGTNPTEAAEDPTCWNNAFVTHLIVAKLNVGFDAADPAYSTSDVPMSQLIRNSGALAGYTVAEIIAFGDEVIGGCSSDFTPNQLRKALRDLNQNFETGGDLGRFDLPFCDTPATFSDECGETGEVTVTFYAQDECGNTDSTSATFVIQDITAPVITTMASDTTTECDGAGNHDQLLAWLANHGGATATEECSEVTWTHSDSTLTAACELTGSVEVTFYATDDCGNVASTAATFTIVDTTNPDLMVEAANDTVDCDGAGNTAELQAWLDSYGGASADDVCSGVAWTDDYDAANFTAACGETGEVTVIFTATDSCGNDTTTMATFVIIDTIAPTLPALTCPADFTLYLDAACTVDADTSNTGAATATTGDACDADPEMTITYSDGTSVYTCTATGDDDNLQGSYTFTRTWSAYSTDDCDNVSDTAMCVQTITVLDTLAPVVTYDNVVNTPCDQYDADSLYAISAMDNCDSDVTITLSTMEGSGSCAGTYIHTYEAVDDCGNKTTVVQTVNLIDTISPDLDIACPDSLTLYLDAACMVDTTTATTGMATITFDDNCDPMPFTEITYSDAVAPGCGSEYVVTRTWTAVARDTCNNDSTVSCIQIIAVEDTLAPVLSCPNDTLVQCDGMGNEADIAAFIASVSATDNCDTDLQIDDDYTAIDTACVLTGHATITFTTSDDCGNMAQCTRTITIIDTIAPAIDVIAVNDTAECDGAGNEADIAAWLADNGGASASDDCSGVVWTHNYAGIDTLCGLTGTAEVTFYATDNCANVDSTTATFTILDTTAPTITVMAADTLAECDGTGNAAQLAAWLAGQGGAMASDECSGVAWTHNYNAADHNLDTCSFSIEVTFYATDNCDNASQTTATFSIEDTTQPEFDPICPLNATVYVDGLCAADTTVATHGSADYENEFDLCDSDLDITVTHTDSVSYPCVGSMVVTRHWTITAEDDCENVTVKPCTQTITVNDSTPPMITCAVDTVVECDGSGNEAAFDAFIASFSATDNCPGIVITDTVVTVSDSCGGAELREVWFFATDACSNTDSCMATFEIVDTTKPYVTVTWTDTMEVFLDAMCMLDTSFANLGGLTAEAEDLCSGAFETITYEDSEATATCPCEPQIDTTVFNPCRLIPGNYRTQTMGGWGQDNCNGDNPACYRDANFASAFPSGVTIGCATGETLTFTTSNAVAVFLPCGGPAGALASSATDPTCISNVLAGQLLTAKLSLGFDAADPNFGSSPVSATELVINDGGAYDGWTIAQVVSRADSVLGGCLNESASNLSDALATFNESFVDGDNYEMDGTTMVPTMRLGNCEVFYITIEECDEEQEGSYSFDRTFTVTGTDECLNDSVATYVQHIMVRDTVAPVFTEACGILNGVDYDVCCEDLDGTVDIPEPCDVEAMDHCDSEVNITFTESYGGDYPPSGDVVSYCVSTMPEAYDEGETCNGLDPHSLRLFGADIADLAEFYSPVGESLVENYADGSWSLMQEVVAMDGSGGGWLVHVTYGAAMSWDEWQNDYETPPASDNDATSFKLDCQSLAMMADHTTWDYRIMESGTLTGTGTYSGSMLSLSHSPSNHFYAFQIGEGANNQNANYGYSGWIMASGTFNGVPVMISGDIFGDLDCCLPWHITRTWTATDDCKNSASFTQVINVNDDDCPMPGEPMVVGGDLGDDHTPVVIGGAGDLTTGKSPIRVTNLQPNPTNDWSLLGFTVTENMRLRVDMVSMDGILVEQLFDGIAAPNVNHTLDIEADQLQSGMYQIRLSSSQYLVVKKLLVTE